MEHLIIKKIKEKKELKEMIKTAIHNIKNYIPIEETKEYQKIYKKELAKLNK